MQSLRTEIGAEIRNRNGKLLRRLPFRECHSLLKQFIQILGVQMGGSSQTIKDTGGTNRASAANSLNFSCFATSQTTHGIVIGTGETPVTMTDYKLQTQVTASIVHQTMSFAVEEPDANTWRIAISRGFLNNTGAELNIKEAGLYVLFSGSAYFICADRTLYPVAVPAGTTLTLTYRITVTL